jgi:hypothetical protein
VNYSRIQLRSQVPDDQMLKRQGARALRSELVLEVTNSADVYAPNGRLLIALRRGAIPKEICERAYPTLQLAKKHGSDNRVSYAGFAYGWRKRADGSYARQMTAVDEDGNRKMVNSAVAGYFDADKKRFHCCRTTAFTARHVAEWQELLPMIRLVGERFAEEFPVAYNRQKAFVDACSPDFVIQGTPFTTLTINVNVLGTIHKDAGDYKDGLGCISVVRRGQYAGALLCFPQYKVGVELFDGDLIFFDPHEWHAVTEFEGQLSDDHERISIVYYAREGIRNCGSAVEELEKAKAKEGAL